MLKLSNDVIAMLSVPSDNPRSRKGAIITVQSIIAPVLASFRCNQSYLTIVAMLQVL
jgi:hypothetical protein